MTEWVQRAIKHLRRLGGWWVAAVLALVVISMIASQQLGVLVYKIVQVQVGIILAYVADRALFRHAPARFSPEMPRDTFGAARLLARAIVSVGVILGVTIGI